MPSSGDGSSSRRPIGGLPFRDGLLGSREESFVGSFLGRFGASLWTRLADVGPEGQEKWKPEMHGHPHPRLAAATEYALLIAAAVVALSVLLMVPERAAAQRLPTTIFTETEGLPSSKIVDLRQDESGRLWVLTRAGLAVYDGKRFEPPHPADGVALRQVVAITLGAEHDLWAMSDGSQPAVARWRDGVWNRLDSPPQLGYDVRGGRVLLAALPSEDGPGLLIASAGGTYQVWDGRLWRQPQGIPKQPPTAVLARSWGALVATYDGLYRLESVHQPRLERFGKGLVHAEVLALAAAANGGVWLLTTTGLDHLDGDALRRVVDASRMPQLRTHTRATMVEDGFGGLFFGTERRGFHLDPQRRTLRQIGVSEGLVSNDMVALERDREGSVWVASGRGLTRIASQRFLSYGQAQGLLEPEVTAVLEVGPDHIVLGHNHGLTHLDHGTVRTISLPLLDSEEVGVTRILDLARDAEGRLWAAASGYGVARFDVDGSIHRFGKEVGIDIAQSVETDAQGDLWLASSYGLFRWRDEHFELVDTFPKTAMWIRWLTFLNGDTFLSTDSGLLRRQHDGGAWQRIGDLDDPMAESVYRLLRDRRGRTWVGTGAGLFWLNGDGLERAEHGGPRIDRPVYVIVEDDDGNLWFGTDNGVFLWQGSILRHLSVGQGLAGRETNRGAAMVDHRGQVWIGTERGISRYQPRYDLRHVAPPGVELRRVDTAAASFALDRPWVFDHTDRNLTFFFQAVTLAPELGLRLRCRLQGFDSAWLDPCPQRVGVRYTNLPAGRYRFQVQARHDDGPWGKISTSDRLRVRAPLWRQRPFQFLAGGLLVFAVLAFWRAFESKRQAAEHDPLTGLANRRRFFRRLDHAIEHQRPGGGAGFAVLFLDLDGFKHVNDSLGHLVGDRFLVAIAARLGAQLRPGERIARIGGDEFAVLVESSRGVPAVEPVVERIRQAFRQPFEVGGRELFSGASIGVVLGDAGYTRPEQVLRDADSAMYRAKERGRGRFEVFDPAMLSRATARLDLETDLRYALEAQQLVLDYQPIVSLDGQRVACLEALLRWEHPVRGRLPPDAFIGVAEETGLIMPIGAWVIEEVCRQLAVWLEASAKLRRQRVHINVAAAQLYRLDFVPRLIDTVLQAGIDPSSVALELTERTIVDDFDTAAHTLHALRDRGIRVFLDDFGRGQTSLRYLRRLPFDGLKLDRAFVADLGTDPRELAIAQMVSRLGRDLGLQVVAEGVETAQQAELVTTLSCDAAQGFFYHRPMSPVALAALFEGSCC